jgi:hypothetical protein
VAEVLPPIFDAVGTTYVVTVIPMPSATLGGAGSGA